MIALQYVDKATFPNDVILYRCGEETFVLRCGDYIWDWGLYDWSPRWVYDNASMEGIDASWFVGRYEVTGDKILADFDDGVGYPGGPVGLAYGGLEPISPPDYFKSQKSPTRLYRR